MANRRWVIEFDDLGAIDELVAALHADEDRRREERERRYGPSLELLVDRYAGLVIEIYSDEHPPPHFHVACGAGKASFRISDGSPLHGDLGREERTIRRWHARNKPKLVAKWNASRPSDCPVGPYRDA